MRIAVYAISVVLALFPGAQVVHAQALFEVDKIAPISGPLIPDLDTSTRSCDILQCAGKGNGLWGYEPASIVVLNRSSSEWPEHFPYRDVGFGGVNNCVQCSHEGDAYFPGVLAKQWQCPAGYATSPTSKFKCVRQGLDPGKNNECDETTGCGKVGNPINFLTGVKTEVAIDYKAPVGHLEFIRYYSSIPWVQISTAPLGPEWKHNYLRTLKVNSLEVGATAFLTRPSGDGYFFTRNELGEWKAEPDVPYLMREVYDNGVIDGWFITGKDEVKEFFDKSGVLIRIEWPDGGFVRLVYELDVLTYVIDEKGRSLSFSYQDGNLSRVIFPDGSSISYLQASVYSWRDIRLVKVSFFASGESESGSTISYGYGIVNGSVRLLNETDEIGNLFSTWTYDGAGKGTGSVRGDPGGNISRVSIYYSGAAATVTNSLGASSMHQFGSAFGRAKLTSSQRICEGCGGDGFQSRTYDANGYPDVTVSHAGDISDADYDSRGLLSQKIDAKGTQLERTTGSVN